MDRFTLFPDSPTFLTGRTLKILRIIDSFQPNQEPTSQQVWQISRRLAQKGVLSPILTTQETGHPAPPKETRDAVPVTRVPVQCSLGFYQLSLGMITYLRNYHLVHCHRYPTFQTDCAFFLRG